ncbi:YgfZ/GcvT domain-containing protein [Jannaschia sp. CCS1]|uniref:CAF17-like 4Fe-4S cluster assembly/insertion protein YgfZ n=1 Tax=Jannaschia sp. (strain CCS1) TaxID=290400 RepID=UPI000053D654|nr:folate-binding protein YgfZ [Jannaschia sp. CCS1]ABD56388.1 glycine cleavage T protein (aminomethyl transferase) [Jannaschia sp. CCS1]
MIGERAEDRTILRLSGADAHGFLQGLVTRDAGEGLTYSALLTPQGKYLADFFLLDRGDDILLDVKSDIARAVAQRLGMYRLRADVTIEEADLPVARGLGDMPAGAFADPRDPSLGWRAYGVAGGDPVTDWTALRVAACVPETGVELTPNDTYILEAGFDRLCGVDHKKGCYLGQEVTARMKHKTELKKGFVTVSVDGTAPVGTAIMAGEKPAGTLYTQAGGQGIAYLRFDRATGPMTAAEARVTWKK